jgi:hypothetical protein
LCVVVDVVVDDDDDDDDNVGEHGETPNRTSRWIVVVVTASDMHALSLKISLASSPPVKLFSSEKFSHGAHSS